MRIDNLTLILTGECTAHCAHCFYRAGPGRDRTMNAGEVKRYLAAIRELPIERITISGGEPFLLPELLQSVVAAALHVAPVDVPTNAF